MTAYEETGMGAQARMENPTTAMHAAVPDAAPRPERTPLAVVPAPLKRSGVGVVVFCSLVLVVALAAVLVLNITMSNRQYTLLELRQRQAEVTEVNQRLSEQVGYLEAPQNLAARADVLGMVTSDGALMLDAHTGEIMDAPEGVERREVSATFVAPPVDADRARQRTDAAATPDGEIPGPRIRPADAEAPDRR